MFAKATNVGFAQRVVATLVASAILLWSIGAFGSTAQAANLTTISDTLSDSDVSVVSNHTLTFSTPSGVANGDTIDIDFSDGPFVLGTVDYTDVDVSVNGTGDLVLAASCGGGGDQVGVDVSGWPVMTLTFCSGEGGLIAAYGTTTIEIGTNATFGTTGDQQLTNPAAGSHEIVVTAGATPDTGRTRVAIIDNVLVTAQVSTSFDFTITGLATSTAVNGTSTTGSTSAQLIPFGNVAAGEVHTLAQRLTVSTNARNGYIVTVQSDGDLESATGAVIDTFVDGYDTATSGNSWVSPSYDISDEATWGHWGMTYDDSDNGPLALGANEYIAVSPTVARTVLGHDGPADGLTTDIGTTTVGYTLEITALQEAADDYSTVLTYVATPTF